MSGRNSNKEEIDRFLARDFPQSKGIIEAVGPGTATVRIKVGIDELRPGGTVSGPVMMTAADLALYVAILGEVGIVPLAVTTSMTINFLRKPAANCDIIGVCRLLKTGRTLIMGEVSIYSDGGDEPVAHVTGTYAIPPGAAK